MTFDTHSRPVQDNRHNNWHIKFKIGFCFYDGLSAAAAVDTSQLLAFRWQMRLSFHLRVDE